MSGVANRDLLAHCRAGAANLGEAMSKDQQAAIEWRDGVPVSRQFNDPYYSLEDGLAETHHVFLQGNDLPARFAQGFHIAELGFGTGLNALAAWQAWKDAGHQGQLHFTSFEAFPMSAPDMQRSLAAYPTLEPLSAQLVQAWEKGCELTTDDFSLQVILGDARQTLPHWDGFADAWFLDGFAPAQNPELWHPDLLEAVARHTNPGGTVATYTAAGAVRRALDAAGFSVTRIAGFGRKRHMTVGTLAQ